jgi:hypothetical protein
MDLNRVAKAISRAIRDYKRLTGVDVDLAPALEAKIKSGDFDSIVPISGAGGKPLNQLVAMIEAGGLPPDGLAYVQIAPERWFRNPGLGEAQTGRADAQATATAVAVATTESNRRSARTLTEWAQFNQSIGDRVSFHVFTSKSVKIRLGPEATRALARDEREARAETTFFEGGGLTPEEYDALAVKLDAESLTPETPEVRAQKALLGHEVTMGTLQGMAQWPFPQFWVPYMEQLGRDLRVPRMRESAESFLVGATALFQQQMAQAMAPAPPAPATTVKVHGGPGGGSSKPAGRPQGASGPSKGAAPGLPSANAMVSKAGGQARPGAAA